MNLLQTFAISFDSQVSVVEELWIRYNDMMFKMAVETKHLYDLDVKSDDPYTQAERQLGVALNVMSGKNADAKTMLVEILNSRHLSWQNQIILHINKFITPKKVVAEEPFLMAERYSYKDYCIDYKISSFELMLRDGKPELLINDNLFQLDKKFNSERYDGLAGLIVRTSQLFEMLCYDEIRDRERVYWAYWHDDDSDPYTIEFQSTGEPGTRSKLVFSAPYKYHFFVGEKAVEVGPARKLPMPERARFSNASIAFDVLYREGKFSAVCGDREILIPLDSIIEDLERRGFNRERTKNDLAELSIKYLHEVLSGRHRMKFASTQTTKVVSDNSRQTLWEKIAKKSPEFNVLAR